MLWMWLLFVVTDRSITEDDGNVPELPAQCAYVLVLLLPVISSRVILTS